MEKDVADIAMLIQISLQLDGRASIQLKAKEQEIKELKYWAIEVSIY